MDAERRKHLASECKEEEAIAMTVNGYSTGPGGLLRPFYVLRAWLAWSKWAARQQWLSREWLEWRNRPAVESDSARPWRHLLRR